MIAVALVYCYTLMTCLQEIVMSTCSSHQRSSFLPRANAHDHWRPGHEGTSDTPGRPLVLHHLILCVDLQASSKRHCCKQSKQIQTTWSSMKDDGFLWLLGLPSLVDSDIIPGLQQSSSNKKSHRSIGTPRKGRFIGSIRFPSFCSPLQEAVDSGRCDLGELFRVYGLLPEFELQQVGKLGDVGSTSEDDWNSTWFYTWKGSKPFCSRYRCVSLTSWLNFEIFDSLYSTNITQYEIYKYLIYDLIRYDIDTIWYLYIYIYLYL